MLATVSVKKKLQHQFGKKYKYYRPVYTVFAFAGLISIIYYQINLSTYQLFNLSTFSFIAGLVITYSGLLIMVICIAKYFFTLSGLRSLVKDQKNNELIITGLHRHVRHPLYLGTFMFIWGLFILLPYLSILISNTVITIYTLIGIGLEEKKLIAEYGEKYISYQSQTPKLIPGFKAKR